MTDALDTLRQADPALAAALDAAGPPVMRRRPGGYPGLFRIICEQQLSVESARAILARCEARLPPITPQAVLSADEEDLRACGLSRPKIRYARLAAEAVESGALPLGALSSDDAEAAGQLTAVTGIGPWTAAIYLLFCEGREDVWPRGDVALLAAYAAASGFAAKPALKEFDAMASVRFAPYRGTAAHILWTYYAHLKGRRPG